MTTPDLDRLLAACAELRAALTATGLPGDGNLTVSYHSHNAPIPRELAPTFRPAVEPNLPHHWVGDLVNERGLNVACFDFASPTPEPAPAEEPR